MKEAYVSFEIAKLLKEKGFDEPLFEFYSDTGKVLYSRHSEGLKISELDNELGNYYPHITHQMAMAWLREKHNMHVDIDPSEGDWYPCVIELETWSSLTSGKMPICNSYEEAVEAGLKYALEELI